MHYININEIEKKAKIKLKKDIYDFCAGGATDEITLQRNTKAFNEIKLIPRVLTGIAEPDTRVSLLGLNLSFPVLNAPVAFQCLLDPLGEIAVAKALHDHGLAYICSTMSTISLEELANQCSGPKWFQLYILKDRNLTLELVKRAELSGYQCIILTVDMPIMGKRERDFKNNFEMPHHLGIANFTIQNNNNLFEGNFKSSIKVFTDSLFEPRLCWKDIDWLRSHTTLPIILKGVMRDEDAEKAIDVGASAIVVSNHGGRQLDGVASSIELLTSIANKINKRIPILLDGGIRRGTDIIKSLALGADCVLLGRPLLWGLAISGQAGVTEVISILKQEFIDAMILCGYSTVKQVKEDKKLVSKNF